MDPWAACETQAQAVLCGGAYGRKQERAILRYTAQPCEKLHHICHEAKERLCDAMPSVEDQKQDPRPPPFPIIAATISSGTYNGGYLKHQYEEENA